MHWFWFALAAPALFALSNQIDKFLLHHKVEKDTHSVARLIIYSSFIGVVSPRRLFCCLGLSHLRALALRKLQR